MPDSRRIVGLLVALAVLVALFESARGTPAARPADGLGEVRGARYKVAEQLAGGSAELPQDVRDAGLTFGATVSPVDREAVLAAIAGARPEARRLIDLVDGLVDIEVGRPSARAAGQTLIGGARYPVMLDIAGVRARWGQRGVARLVLHELGHVVDHAVLPDDLVARLDAEIPRGYGCEQGVGGACASREERFAETFAKWATNDIGMNIDLGYQVPPPSLATWGAPLAAIAAPSA